MLESIAPGIHYWQTKDAKAFRSYAIEAERQLVLIDPVGLTPDELKDLEAMGEVKAIVLTSSWHERDADSFACHFHVPVYAHPEAIPELKHFEHELAPLPETLPLGLRAWTVPGGFPGQVAYYWDRDGGSLITGDCWHNVPFADLPWYMRLVLKHVVKVRDGLHLTPPEKARDSQAIIEAYRGYLAEFPLERLLVTHGKPILEGARAAMLARLDLGP